MKKLATIAAILAAGCALAGVPVKWTVETSRADTQEVPCYHGETLDMEVTFKNYGQDLYVPTNVDAQIFWQTNGMSAFYWRTNNVTVVSNKMYATFLPEMDPGTVSCKGFVGVPGQIYRASFVLRFKNSPGLEPKVLEWPYRELDFAKVEVKNAPYYEKAVVDQKDAENRTWTETQVPILVDLTLTNKEGVVIGRDAQATEFDGVVVDGVAIGRSAKAYALHNTAIGVAAEAGRSFYSGQYATAIGGSAKALGDQSIAVGKNTKAEGLKSTAVGSEAETKKEYATAIGPEALADGEEGVAIGYRSVVSNQGSVAIGKKAKVTGIWSTAIGFESKATGPTSLAVGWNANAYGDSGTAVGLRPDAAAFGVALGYHSSAGYNSSALGSENEASGQNSVAVGPAPELRGSEWYEGKAKAKGRSSISVGGRVESGINGITIGEDALVTNNYAVVISTSEQHVTDKVNGSHGVGTITLGVKNSDPQKVYIGNKTLKTIVEENGITNETDPTVSSWAKAATKPTYSAAEVGAYSAASGNTLATQMSTIGAHLNTEDARFVSTNYNSVTKMPEAYVEVKQMNQTTGSNEWLRVWSEMTRWDKFVGAGFDWTSWGGFHAWRTNITEQIARTSPKEYAFYDGVTGEVAPDGFFWIAQPRVAVCAGMGYQRYMDAGGMVWILESNGMVANVNGTTNGYFRISDEEGNSQFEIIKGDKQTVGATAYSMRSETVMGVVHRYVEYAVTNALAAPTAKFCRNLSSQTWIADTEASCPCNVTWTPGVNSYTLEFWPKATEPQMFVKAEYDWGGETRIKNSVPTEMQYIILNGTKYQLVPKTIGGELVMGLVAE